MRSSRYAALASVVAVGLMLGSAALVLVGAPSSSGPVAATGADSPTYKAPSTGSWTVSSLRTGSFVNAPDQEVGLSVAGASLVGPASFATPANPLGTTQILVTLDFSNATELGHLLAQLSDPTSAQFHQYLTHAEFDQRFGGVPSVYSALTGYFESFGVYGLVTHPDRLAISFQATPAQVDSIFHTQLGSYRSPSGLSYFAPTSPPEVPAIAAPYVAEVTGFSNYSQYLVHANSQTVGGLSGAVAASAVAGTSSGVSAAGSCGTPCAPGGSSNPFRHTTVGGLTYDVPVYADQGNSSGCSSTVCGDFVQAPDLQVTYNETGLFHQYGYPVNVTVVAMLWSDTICNANHGSCRTGGFYNSYCSGLATGSYAWDFFAPDVASFWNYTLPVGEPMPNAVGLPLIGSSSYAYPAGSQGLTASCDKGGAEVENTLDVSMLGSMAPGANVIDVFGQGSSTVTLENEFASILSPSASAFNNSGDTNTATNLEHLSNVSVISNSWTSTGSLGTAWNLDLQMAQVLGITVLASTGDGANNAVLPPAATAFNTYGDVAVGGTTLVVNNRTLLRTHDHLAGLAPAYPGVGGGEITWYEPAGTTYGFSTTAGTAGGVTSASTNYAPVWQNDSSDAHGVTVGIAGTNPGRGEPDIAATANDTLINLEEGMYSLNFTCIVDSNCTGVSSINAGATTGFYTYVIGTSISSQVMAGLIATMDHALVEAGHSRLGFLDPQAYALGQLEFGGNLLAPPFYDVALYHTLEPSSSYGAFAGWDAVTGWGVIDAGNYVGNVLNPSPPPPSFPTPIKHVVVIMEENKNYSYVLQHAPFEAYLANTYATSTNSYALRHASIPTYQAATSAVDYSNWTVNVRNLADLAQRDGLTWATFEDSMPTPCYRTADWATGYMTAHDPAIMFSDIALNQARCQAHDLTWSSWLNDVNTSTIPNYAFLTPNATHDGHNGSSQIAQITNTDVWLHDLLTPLVNDSAIFSDTAFIVAYDEANPNYSPFVNGTTGGPVYTVVVSPYSMGLSSNHFYTSFSLLTTAEWLLGLPGGTLGTNDSWSVSPPMMDLFSFPPASQHTVAYTESGLASGTNWSVTLAGQTKSSTGSTISFRVTNATYPYTVAGAVGYLATPSSGSTTVNGASVSVAVSFVLENPALQALLGVYDVRPDLQSAFPNAQNGGAALQQLVSWAGGAASGLWPDTNFSTLAPYGYWYALMRTYNDRSDLQAAFPNAYSNSTNYGGLVGWASEAVSGAFTDGAATLLQPYGYYYDLMSVYGKRSDLQSAFPSAYTNETGYQDLVIWAGYVMTGHYADGANATLQPYGYWYGLMGTYLVRPDLQAAFPNALSNFTEYSALVTWASEAVAGQFADGAGAVLAPYGYYYTLMMVYGQRNDLQAAFPDGYTNTASYTGLVEWAGQVVTGVITDGANATLQPYGYYYDLMGIYGQRTDLQAAFPQAYSNSVSYGQLLTWAKEVVEQVFPDGAYAQLEVYAAYYIAHG